MDYLTFSVSDINEIILNKHKIINIMNKLVYHIDAGNDAFQNQIIDSVDSEDRFIQKEILIKFITKINSISDCVLVDEDSFIDLMQDPKTDLNRLKLAIWFQRYISALDEFKSTKDFMNEDILYFIFTSLFMILHFEIPVNEVKQRHAQMHSNHEKYRKLNNLYLSITDFQIINLKINSIYKSKINFNQLLGFIKKCNIFVDQYNHYIEIQKYHINNSIIISSHIGYLINLAIIAFSFKHIIKLTKKD